MALRGIPRWNSPKTNPHRVRSSGSRCDWCSWRVRWRADWGRCRNSRYDRIVHIGVGEATSRRLRGTPRNRCHSAEQWGLSDHLTCIPPENDDDYGEAGSPIRSLGACACARSKTSRTAIDPPSDPSISSELVRDYVPSTRIRSSPSRAVAPKLEKGEPKPRAVVERS
jgi:hypothetical protein